MCCYLEQVAVLVIAPTTAFVRPEVISSSPLGACVRMPTVIVREEPGHADDAVQPPEPVGLSDDGTILFSCFLATNCTVVMNTYTT